jgi:hypothetical protein
MYDQMYCFSNHCDEISHAVTIGIFLASCITMLRFEVFRETEYKE